jgi:hypothetical protein
MILDNKKQQEIILQLLDAVTIPGKALDDLYQFKLEVLRAHINEDTNIP